MQGPDSYRTVELLADLIEMKVRNLATRYGRLRMVIWLRVFLLFLNQTLGTTTTIQQDSHRICYTTEGTVAATAKAVSVVKCGQR